MSHWGNAYWRLFHDICESEPDDEQLKKICESFAKTLPCPTCRRHFNFLIKKYNASDFDSKKHFGEWLHDEVNTFLGKPRFKTTADKTPLPAGAAPIQPPNTRKKTQRTNFGPVPVSKQANDHRGNYY